MEAAKAAVNKITGRRGHTTEVDEVVNTAVTSETVKPHRHEETQEAVDREVHQHHYHTTVQPVAHKEVLPEKHHHNIVPQVEREIRHDNEQDTHRRVSQELGQFKNTTQTQHTTQSTSAAPTVTGEHVHHHVHETVQPVIHKETIQPEVVHTTVPIHETHVEKAQHHGMSALPMKTLDEFKTAGGVLTGSKSHTHEEYEGAPRPYNDKLRTTIDKVLPGHHDHSTTGTNTTSGFGTNETGRDLTGNHSTGLTGSHTNDGLTGSRGTTGSSGVTGNFNQSDHRTGVNTNQRDSGIGSDTYVTSDNNFGTTQKKPSVMDKLNPKVDADGDGKAGIMS